MRMFSGFGTPEDTNKRLKLLLEHGETGLSIAFDMPTLYGYDADHEKAHGEVGRCGVNVSSLRDMEVDLPRDPARQGQHLDDDQRPGRRPDLHVRRGREEDGGPAGSR